jgi:hypothetical protein
MSPAKLFRVILFHRNPFIHFEGFGRSTYTPSFAIGLATGTTGYRTMQIVLLLELQ